MSWSYYGGAFILGEKAVWLSHLVSPSSEKDALLLVTLTHNESK